MAWVFHYPSGRGKKFLSYLLMIKLYSLFVLAASLFLSCTAIGFVDENNIDTFIDGRDGKKYKYVSIGTQIWMAENLRYDTLSIKCYNNNYDNCKTFGMLYDWNTAKIICPADWHLPSDEEWNILRDFVGNDASKLRANSELWSSDKGTDDFGFTALPGGHFRSGSFNEIRNEAGFWSATAGSSLGSAHYRYLRHNSNVLNLDGHWINDSWANVRCVKD